MRRSPHFRPVIGLLIAYLVVDLLALVVAVLLRGSSTLVTPAVWTRGGIVAASAVVILLTAVSASRGSVRAYRRFRIVSAVVLVAIAVIASIPGIVPTWMRVEQAACGLVLLAALLVAVRPAIRRTFRARGAAETPTTARG
jgi:hypothetical protein